MPSLLKATKARSYRFSGQSTRVAACNDTPPIREVLKQMRLDIEARLNSYREQDGWVRDESAVYEIECLERANDIIRAAGAFAKAYKKRQLEGRVEDGDRQNSAMEKVVRAASA